MKHKKATTQVSRRDPTPRSGRKISNRRSLIMAANKGVSSRFMESFRSVVEGLDEPRKHKEEKRDFLGEELTRLLNEESIFDLPGHESECDDNYFSFTPLLSARNFRFLKRKVTSWSQSTTISRQFNEKASSKQNQWKIFGSTKSIAGSCVMLFGLSFLCLAVSAAAISVAGILSIRCLGFIVIFLVSVLVDFNDLYQSLPSQLRRILSDGIESLRWADRMLLMGYRYRGREWSMQDFAFDNSAMAQSRQADLWACPPPMAKDSKRVSLYKQYTASSQWSKNTAEHIEAIDYCYGMLREAFLRKQYSRLRKAVFKNKKNRNPVMSACENNGDTIAYTRKLNPQTAQTPSTDGSQGVDMREDMSVISSFHTPHETESSFFPAARSPTDAIEVIRQREGFFANDSSSLREHETLHSLPDQNRFAALDDLLEDDDSASSASLSNERLPALDSGSDVANELNWMDVGAEIGMKLLRSSAVQKAIASQDTAAQISNIKEKMEGRLARRRKENPALNVDLEDEINGLMEVEDALLPSTTSKKTPTLPVHPMWTSAAAAARNSLVISPAQTSDSGSGHFSSRVREQLEPDSGSFHTLSPDQERLVLAYDSKTAECTKLQVINDTSQNSTGYKANRGIRGPGEYHREHSAYLALQKDLSPPTLNTHSPSSNNVQSIEVLCGKKRTLVSPSMKNLNRRPPLLPGVKIAVPIFPIQPGARPSKRFLNSRFQMGTVVSSKRILVGPASQLSRRRTGVTNCLSITLTLDKSFLRNGMFAELTMRVMDAWGSRYMPKHSKVPLGSCVATIFGPGVLVGWRVEDDVHVVGSLWQRRGPGSAYAYLNRDAIKCTLEAAVGFEVETSLGRGKVVAYVGGAQEVRSGKFFALMEDEGKYQDCTLELNRTDIHACRSAKFVPVVEHIREAAKYQLQVDSYTAALEESESNLTEHAYGKTWRHLSKYFDILWSSFMNAIDEDDEFDEGMNDFIASVVNFLNRLDAPTSDALDVEPNDDTNIVITATESTQSKILKEAKGDPGFLFMNEVFGIFGSAGHDDAYDEDDLMPSESIEVECSFPLKVGKPAKKSYDRTFDVIRTLMRTVSLARAACVDEPNFKLAMSLCYEFLQFSKTVIKVQQKNISPHSLRVWRRAWEEIVSTFGPVKDRIHKIGQGIAERMQKQGRRAKIRLLRFVDTIVQDDALLSSIEQGDWDRCGEQLEYALVKARIIDEENRELYHKTAQFIYNHFAVASSRNGGAAARNNEKLAKLATIVQWIAAPRRSLLKLFLDDKVLDILERILVRVFQKEDVASRMISIHSANFQTLRQFRMLKDFTIAGKLWIPLLDAADAEFSWLVSKLPENAKDILCPLSSLFSLCVVQFHKIGDGDLTQDWLDFLLEEEAVSIIHDIDMKLILALESISRDVKEMMVVLPYYPSIEDDILNLVDEVDVDEFLKEASEAIEHAEKLSEFIREKTTIAIERFLDYVPKMSIPVEKRDLADGWVLTCRGADGGDLTLTDLTIKRENLTCQVMGGDTIFFPMLGADDDVDIKSTLSMSSSPVAPKESRYPVVESSVLDHIREMILNAQRHGCWQVGIGGINHPPTDRYVASVFQGLPVSSVLNCAIELWRNLEIDDDELLEVAIRDVSYQIQLQEERELAGDEKETKEDHSISGLPASPMREALSNNFSLGSDSVRHRFNPRVDPTVLYLEIKNLTFHLNDFKFRIEKHEDRRTVFDPVFEGSGSLLVRNVSIKVRVDCLKEYSKTRGRDFAVPVLQLRELEVNLEKVSLKVQDTGADWLLNKVVKGFEDNITQIMEANLSDQVRDQIDLALENLNSYFQVNPDLILELLGISIDDLEEKIVWV